MIPEDKRIRTRLDLKDWLKVIGKKYGEGGYCVICILFLNLTF